MELTKKHKRKKNRVEHLSGLYLKKQIKGPNPTAPSTHCRTEPHSKNEQNKHRRTKCEKWSAPVTGRGGDCITRTGCHFSQRKKTVVTSIDRINGRDNCRSWCRPRPDDQWEEWWGFITRVNLYCHSFGVLLFNQSVPHHRQRERIPQKQIRMANWLTVNHTHSQILQMNGLLTLDPFQILLNEIDNSKLKKINWKEKWRSLILISKSSR